MRRWMIHAAAMMALAAAAVGQTDFPTALDEFPVGVDHVTDVNAAMINPIQDAIEALQAAVGVTSSNVTTSLDYRTRLLDRQRVTDQRRYVTPPKVLLWEAFDVAADWTGSTWVAEADTTNVMAGGHGRAGTATRGVMSSLKLTGDGENAANNIEKTLPANVDCSSAGASMILRYYAHAGESGSAPTTLGDGFVYVYDASGNYRYYKYTGSDAFQQGGWITVSIQLANYYGKSATDVNLAQVKKLKVNTQVNDTPSIATPSITYDLIAIVEKHPKAYLMLMDDDWATGAYTMSQTLDTYVLNDRVRYPAGHLTGTFCVVPGKVGCTGYHTAAQMRLAYDNGHAFILHVYDDTTYATWQTMTLDQKKANITASQRWLLGHGIVGGERCLSTTGGYFSPDDYTLVEAGYVDQIRGAYKYFHGVQYKANANNNYMAFDQLFDPRMIQISLDVVASGTMASADYEYALDRLVEHGGLMCIFGHGGNLATLTDFLAKATAMINAGTIELVTAPELAALTEARRRCVVRP